MSDAQNPPAMDRSPSYKERLDEAASSRPKAEAKPESKADAIVEKVSQYVPAVGNMLGKKEQSPDAVPEKKAIPGPPNRPEHDTQIEEFVRDQHKSTPIQNLEE